MIGRRKAGVRLRRRPAALALPVALVAAGCGAGSGGDALMASGFHGPASAAFAGSDPALNFATGGQGPGLPAWRQTVSPGTRLTVSVVLTNRAAEPVTITGLGPRDASRDGLWIPDGILGTPVTLASGASARVTLAGHASDCAGHSRGQSLPYAGAVVMYRGNGGLHSEQVVFDGALELSPSAAARCTG